MAPINSITVAFVVLAALLGGALGAGATLALAGTDIAESKQKQVTKRAASERDSEELAQRLEQLEGELQLLRKRNTSTEALRQYARVLNKNDGADAGKDGDAGSDELDSVVDAEDPTFELAVRTVLDRVDWERQEERRVTQTQRSEERAQRQTELLAERLKLSGPQKQQVQDLLTKQMDSFRKLRSRDNPDTPRPGTRSEWRQRIEAIRTDTEKQLEAVLDESQMSSYRQFVEEEAFGARTRRADSDGTRSQEQRR